jgi:hypothetical protein
VILKELLQQPPTDPTAPPFPTDLDDQDLGGDDWRNRDDDMLDE